MSAVVFLLVCFLSCSVSEEPKIQLITAQPRDNVTLSCLAPNVTIATVQWSRSDLDPNKHVYLKSDGYPKTADQDPSYVNRTQLKNDEMKNGELSLILKNVTNKDEGRYECRYKEKTGGRRKRSDIGGELISIVYLRVTGPPIHVITAKPGDVTLPCQAPNVTITDVLWIRSDLDKHVYLKIDGNLNTAYQDPSYVNRTQLKDDEMKNGNLSLTLKNVNNNDTGTYMCRYIEKATQIKLISIVVLNAKGGDSEGGKYKRQHLGVVLSVTLIAALVL